MRMRAVSAGLALLLAGTLARAAGGGSYSLVPAVEMVNMSDLDENQMTIKAKYYIFGVNDDDTPYRLQPFLQKASWGELSLQDGPSDTSLFSVEGQYVFPDTMVGLRAGLGFGDVGGLDFFAFMVGGIFYIGSEKLAADVSVTFSDTDGTGCTTIEAGARYVMPLEATGGTLELRGAYRSIDPEVGDSDSGILLEARYFFSKELFVGLSFATDNSDLFSVSAGYAHSSGFQAELEIGSNDNYGGDFLRAEVGWRF